MLVVTRVKILVVGVVSRMKESGYPGVCSELIRVERIMVQSSKLMANVEQVLVVPATEVDIKKIHISANDIPMMIPDGLTLQFGTSQGAVAVVTKDEDPEHNLSVLSLKKEQMWGICSRSR